MEFIMQTVKGRMFTDARMKEKWYRTVVCGSKSLYKMLRCENLDSKNICKRKVEKGKEGSGTTERRQQKNGAVRRIRGRSRGEVEETKIFIALDLEAYYVGSNWK